MLGAAIRLNLERRGCRIPQSSPALSDSTTAHNVTRGSFTAPGRREWAVLCSVRDTSIVLIYAEGGSSPIDSVGRTSDDSHLQQMGESGIVYSRAIGAMSPEQIRRLHAQREKRPDFIELPAGADHDGINDAYIGKASWIYYRHNGAWMVLPGADQ